MEQEFDILNRRMEKNLEMRHTYLMFAFTTSIAAIAAMFVTDFPEFSSWICIVPFAVLIPFQGRISYSRLTHAKMEAYIIVFYPQKFEFLEKKMDELKGVFGKIIAIIANYELTLLALVLDGVFVGFKIDVLKTEDFLTLDCILIAIATVLVFAFATYSFPYGRFLSRFIKEYTAMNNS